MRLLPHLQYQTPTHYLANYNIRDIKNSLSAESQVVYVKSKGLILKGELRGCSILHWNINKSEQSFVRTEVGNTSNCEHMVGYVIPNRALLRTNDKEQVNINFSCLAQSIPRWGCCKLDVGDNEVSEVPKQHEIVLVVIRDRIWIGSFLDKENNVYKKLRHLKDAMNKKSQTSTTKDNNQVQLPDGSEGDNACAENNQSFIGIKQHNQLMQDSTTKIKALKDKLKKKNRLLSAVVEQKKKRRIEKFKAELRKINARSKETNIN
ncbi:uncharacterized protein LOC130614259 [Hydractinia symbiolongicarpus]|uniref:uncharacterized protein LOC130614259 n=1 Tax=Hydractinia symbiolongicarpus TaxID=13093 RepID=UPI00254D735B|nr:uncharacterized protein LOC130614259 [Hydractinia symbiolongicarpus]